MPGKRGIYRSIHSSLLDDPGFQLLSANARLVFLTLRLCRDSSTSGIFRFYSAVLVEQTGLERKAVDAALDELAAGEKPWAYIDRAASVVWLRNGLRFDPSINLRNRKHLAGINNSLLSLPSTDLASRFSAYYELPATGGEFRLEPPKEEPARKPNGDAAKGGKEASDAAKIAEYEAWARSVAEGFEDAPFAAFYLSAMRQAIESYYSSNPGQVTANKMQKLARSLSSMPTEAILAAIEIYYDRHCSHKDERYIVGIARGKSKLTDQALLAEMTRHRSGMTGKGLFSEYQPQGVGNA